MAIRQRRWTTATGEVRSRYTVDYFDRQRTRCTRMFEKLKDAKEYESHVREAIKAGTHTAPSKSMTIAQAGKAWLAYVKGENRERSTATGYEQHLRLHILPRLGGDTKLSALTAPDVDRFRTELLADKRIARPTAKKVLQSLKSLLKRAQIAGGISQNVASSASIRMDKRKTRLEIGKDIPLPAEVKQILDACDVKARAVIMTGAMAGLRASELRGLRWQDVDLKSIPAMIHVRQRADRYGVIGLPKSEAGRRTIPLAPKLAQALRKWKLQCPKSDLGLVFPTASGKVEHHKNLSERVVEPALIAAGVVDQDGNARYGLHSLRHFFASWCINPKPEGLALNAKVAQTRLGHASIMLTLDLYGHLFPSNDDGSELAAGEAFLN